jgi:hypothetical protein
MEAMGCKKGKRGKKGKNLALFAPFAFFAASAFNPGSFVSKSALRSGAKI